MSAAALSMCPTPHPRVNKPNTPSMAIADITTALEAAIEAAVRNTCDIRAVGGEIH